MARRERKDGLASAFSRETEDGLAWCALGYVARRRFDRGKRACLHEKVRERSVESEEVFDADKSASYKDEDFLREGNDGNFGVDERRMSGEEGGVVRMGVRGRGEGEWLRKEDEPSGSGRGQEDQLVLPERVCDGRGGVL